MLAGFNNAVEKIVKYLVQNNANGAIQSEISKELGLSSSEVSRIIKKLEDDGLIRREPVVVRGHRTYKIFLSKDGERLLARKALSERAVLWHEVEKALEVPCVSCPYINVCYEGGFYDPRLCPILSNWISRLLSARAR